ncbi:MAG: hypothetical protein ACTSO7_14695 [Candidatus Heimdallarchaeota archaeon]
MEKEVPEEIISPFRNDDVSLTKRTPFHAQWEIFKIRSWKNFAHHPTCSRYNEHYFSLGKFNICVGCTSIYLGLILYTILFFTVPTVFRERPYVIASLPFAGYGLAIIHLFVKFKNKWIKAFFRFTAGFGIGAYLGIIIIVPSWWVRIVLAVLLLGGNTLYGMSRGKNSNMRKCQDCPLRDADPPCRPIHNTNVRVRKLYNIVEDELEKTRQRMQEKKSQEESKT